MRSCAALAAAGLRLAVYRRKRIGSAARGRAIARRSVSPGTRTRKLGTRRVWLGTRRRKVALRPPPAAGPCCCERWPSANTGELLTTRLRRVDGQLSQVPWRPAAAWPWLALLDRALAQARRASALAGRDPRHPGSGSSPGANSYIRRVGGGEPTGPVRDARGHRPLGQVDPGTAAGRGPWPGRGERPGAGWHRGRGARACDGQGPLHPTVARSPRRFCSRLLGPSWSSDVDRARSGPWPHRGMRPLPGLLARLPGRGPRPGARRGAGRSTASGSAILVPDLTVLLDLEPAAAARRAGASSTASRPRAWSFRQRVLEAFRALARSRTGSAGEWWTPIRTRRRSMRTYSRWSTRLETPEPTAPVLSNPRLLARIDRCEPTVAGPTRPRAAPVSGTPHPAAGLRRVARTAAPALCAGKALALADVLGRRRVRGSVGHHAAGLRARQRESVLLFGR